MNTTGTTQGREAAAGEVAARMAAAAAGWLDALDPAQRAAATGGAPNPDAGPDAERRRWYYTPTDHGGLPLGAQRPGQQRLAHQLVASGLSPAGYVTVATIIGLDNVLDHVEGWTVGWGRERGRDPGLYYLRVFGERGSTAPWGWRSADAALDAVHVVWAGPTSPGQPHYYRLQGPRLLVEYDNTQRHANHAHSVWRDPAADFGYDALGADLAAHHRLGLA